MPEKDYEFMRILSKLLLKLWGFTVVGDPGNHIPKKIFAVLSHTSNWDFPLGILLRSAEEIDVQWVGKSSLFKPPFGFIFRKLGGHPVDRTKRTNYVQSVVELYNSHDRLAIAVAPEGTRKKVDRLRTGFYHIARLAGIPIILTQFNFGEKKLVFSPPFYPTGDEERDFQEIYSFFRGVKGKNAELSFDVPDPD